MTGSCGQAALPNAMLQPHPQPPAARGRVRPLDPPPVHAGAGLGGA